MWTVCSDSVAMGSHIQYVQQHVAATDDERCMQQCKQHDSNLGCIRSDIASSVSCNVGL